MIDLSAPQETIWIPSAFWPGRNLRNETVLKIQIWYKSESNNYQHNNYTNVLLSTWLQWYSSCGRPALWGTHGASPRWTRGSDGPWKWSWAAAKKWLLWWQWWQLMTHITIMTKVTTSMLKPDMMQHWDLSFHSPLPASIPGRAPKSKWCFLTPQRQRLFPFSHKKLWQITSASCASILHSSSMNWSSWTRMLPLRSPEARCFPFGLIRMHRTPFRWSYNVSWW